MRVKFLLNFTHIKSIQWFHLASELRRKCIFDLIRTETVLNNMKFGLAYIAWLLCQYINRNIRTF